MTKKKKFKYFTTPFVWLKNKISWLHEQFKLIDETKILELTDRPRTIYQIFFDWIWEIIQYGVLLTIITSYFIHIIPMGIPLSIISLGILRWLVFDSVKKFMENIRK